MGLTYFDNTHDANRLCFEVFQNSVNVDEFCQIWIYLQMPDIFKITKLYTFKLNNYFYV